MISLEGHKDSVNCLCEYEGLILSGSDDGTVRLWDIQTTNRAVKCIINDQSNVVNVWMNENDIIVWYNDCVVKYDMRMNQSNIIIRDGVSFSASENQEILEGKMVKHYSDDHENIKGVYGDSEGFMSLLDIESDFDLNCTHLAHESGITSLDGVMIDDHVNIVTGGMDTKIKFWEVQNNVVELSDEYSMNEILQSVGIESDHSNKQLINPPFVNTLALSKFNDADVCAAGLGDGTVVYFQKLPIEIDDDENEIDEKVEEKYYWLPWFNQSSIHSYYISHLEFLSLDQTESHNKDHIISAGGDNKLYLWNINQYQLQNELEGIVEPIFEYYLNATLNWFTTYNHHGLGPSIVLADTTPIIKILPIS